MSKSINCFSNFGLSFNLIKALTNLGYEIPYPIQLKCIPYLLSGRDVLGMAHTGSGKTIAFVLPLLNNINVNYNYIQGLIITPTRELAIQVGKVCIDFSKYIKELKIVTLYGGNSYNIELRALKEHQHLVISTPGRLIDHLNRGTVDLSQLKTLIIDEADEMLRMGFIKDIKKIVLNIPIKRQTALFSATLPMTIRRISMQFMRNPKTICIDNSNSVCIDIKQNFWIVNGISKNEALMRFLETEKFDAAIVFMNTKHETVEVSNILAQFGYNSAALNGDMSQDIRYKTMSRLRSGKLDILIATDIAARGLDISRVSLVINYNVPINVGSYIHRIGRTGRAGKIGKSLLFVERKEYYLLRKIERVIHVKIVEVQYPTAKTLLSHRLVKFSEIVAHQLHTKNLHEYCALLSEIKPDINLSTEKLAAVLLKMAQGNRPLVLPPDPIPKKVLIKDKTTCIKKQNKKFIKYRNYYIDKTKSCNISDSGTDFYRISLGKNDGVKIKHIVRVLLSKKVDISYHEIGKIELFPFYSIVELSKRFSKKKILWKLSHLRIFDKPINIKLLEKDSVV